MFIKLLTDLTICSESFLTWLLPMAILLPKKKNARNRGQYSQPLRRCARRIPSIFPPMRSIAFRERAFRMSVCRQTRGVPFFKSKFQQQPFRLGIYPSPDSGAMQPGIANLTGIQRFHVDDGRAHGAMPSVRY